MITTGFYRVAFHRKKLHAKAAFICNYPQCVCTEFFPKTVCGNCSHITVRLLSNGGVDFLVSSTNVRHVMKLIVNMLSEDNLFRVSNVVVDQGSEFSGK